MEQIHDFSFLEQRLKKMGKRRSVALACPHDSHTEYVIERALQEGFASFTLVTAGQISERLGKAVEANRQWVKIIECANAEEASRQAVTTVRKGEAEVLMKGTVNTDVLLRAVLDKENGILREGNVMTHIAAAQIPGHGRLLMFSDAAVIPRPTLEQYHAIVGECVKACRRLGIDEPCVALTHCTEKISPKFEHTLSYKEIIGRARNGAYGKVTIDGPMDVKTALDTDSGEIKGIHSPVAGKADVLIFPNIESGNTFYKTITLFANALIAGWLAGTTVPVVVNSRADSEESKYYSLALACV